MVGQRVGNAFNVTGSNRAKELLLGIILAAHLVWIPILGWLTLTVLSLMGLGGITMNWWPKLKERWFKWRDSGWGRGNKKKDGTNNGEESPVTYEQPKE